MLTPTKWDIYTMRYVYNEITYILYMCVCIFSPQSLLLCFLPSSKLSSFNVKTNCIKCALTLYSYRWAGPTFLLVPEILFVRTSSRLMLFGQNNLNETCSSFSYLGDIFCFTCSFCKDWTSRKTPDKDYSHQSCGEILPFWKQVYIYIYLL